ncbi:MAG: hypothetical protein M3N29_04915 [Chloroflexota bacterium]|nr:hypothetical protein [Chloroflexota bacterium]
MNESVVVIILLAAIAGGGIIVIDWLVIRKIRRLAASEPPTGRPTESTEDRSIGR